MSVAKRILLLSIMLLPLAALAGEADQAQQIVTLYQQGETEKADGLLTAFLAEFPGSQKKCELLLASAQAPVTLYETTKRMRTVMQQCEGHEEGIRATFGLASVLHLSGQDSSAYVICRDFLEQHPEHELVPQVLLLRGALEMRYRGGTYAGNSYATFLAKFPGHPQAIVALVGIADAKFMHGDYQGALQAYQRALAADPSQLELPKIYLHIGMAAEQIGKPEMARHFYEELLRLFGDSPYAARARDRLETTVMQRGSIATPQQPMVRYAVSVGIYPTMSDAENEAQRFSSAGHKVHFILRGKKCELLIGQFDNEMDAQLFAQELAKRYQIQAVPQRLP